MHILWEANRPMLASEIVNAKEELNINTVQSALKAMIEKGYIKVAEITHSRTVFARTYRPVVSKEAYLKEVCDEFGSNLGSCGIFAALIEQEEDIRKLDELEKLIVKAKERLGNVIVEEVRFFVKLDFSPKQWYVLIYKNPEGHSVPTNF